MPIIGLSKPAEQEVSEFLILGSEVPSGLASKTSFSIIVFLRHTGCPFAEAMIKDLSDIAETHPELTCIAVCHGEKGVTQAWLNEFELSSELQIEIDENREIYGKWGLGYAGIRHLLHLGTLVNLAKLFLEGIHNRDASGTRWQPHASFLISPKQTVEWCHYPKHAGDIPKLYSAIKNIWNESVSN